VPHVPGIEQGSFILQVSAADPDINPSLTYSLVPSSTNGSAADEDSFAIDRNSGKIFVACSLDYELQILYMLNVMVRVEFVLEKFIIANWTLKAVIIIIKMIV